MSEQIPESIPTYQDPKSRRAVKKRALTPTSAQASQVDALFAHVEKDVVIPITATKDAVAKRLAPPPEIVANVQGSSAGAGSGEFHVYKASRRREYERLRLMDEETKKEKDSEEFEKKKEELKQKDEAKTNKNKARREKAKARKNKAQTGSDMDVDVVESSSVRKRIGPLAVSRAENGENGEPGVESAGQPENGAKAVVEEAGIVIHDDG